MMRIITTEIPGFSQPIIGNVYPINGGYGRKVGHSMVLLAITRENKCLLLVIDKDGEPMGITSYGLHAIEDRSPVAFVPGLENLVFQMEPLK